MTRGNGAVQVSDSPSNGITWTAITIGHGAEQPLLLSVLLNRGGMSQCHPICSRSAATSFSNRCTSYRFPSLAIALSGFPRQTSSVNFSNGKHGCLHVHNAVAKSASVTGPPTTSGDSHACRQYNCANVSGPSLMPATVDVRACIACWNVANMLPVPLGVCHGVEFRHVDGRARFLGRSRQAHVIHAIGDGVDCER